MPPRSKKNAKKSNDAENQSTAEGGKKEKPLGRHMIAGDDGKPRLMSKPERIAALKAKTRSDGRAIIMSTDEVEMAYFVRRPFDIVDLDIEIGGGLPAGTLNVIWGQAGVGKNFLVNRLIKNIQEDYGDEAAITFASCGYGYDKVWAIQHGVAAPLNPVELEAYENQVGGLTDEQREACTRSIGTFDLVYPNYATEGVADAPVESMLLGLLNVIRSGDYQLVVLDEANVPTTREDLNRDLAESDQVAALPRLIGRFIGRMLAALAEPAPDGGPNRTTVVLILESRDLISITATPGTQRQSGGQAKNHIKAIDIRLKKGDPISASSKTVGHQIEWKIDKGKIGAHEGGTGRYPFYFADSETVGGIDDVHVLANNAVKMGVIGISGSWYSYNGETNVAQGMGSLKAWIRDSGKFREIYDACLGVAKMKVRRK
jgi:hypothetical protein